MTNIICLCFVCLKGGSGSVLDDLDQTAHPWLVKTHMPASIFDQQIQKSECKIIVIMRNPKDLLVSAFHFYRSLGVSISKEMPSFIEYMKRGETGYGDWLSHVLSWWQHRHLPNVHVIKFEDMKSDPRAAIRQLAQFMEVDLTEDQVDVIVEQTTFTALKNNPAVNRMDVLNFDSKISPLMRKGEVGGWKEEFTQEMTDFVEEHFINPAGRHGLTFSENADL